VLVALGLMLFAIGVAAGASLLQAPRSPTASNTSPSPGQLSVRVLKAPPANQRLLWFRDDTTGLPFVIRATDWSGHTLGQLAIDCASCGVLPSPDGQRLLIGDQSTPGPAWHRAPNPDRVFSSSGKPLGIVDGYQAEWSDENGGQLCALREHRSDPVHRRAELVVTDAATGAARTTAAVTTAQATTLTGSWTLVSCNRQADRALLVFTHSTVRALRVLQLSSGRALLATDVTGGATCDCPVLSVAVSGGGTVGTENLVNGAVRELDLADGRELPAVNPWIGKGPVLSLSWAGHAAVTPVGVFSFPSGEPLWQAPLPAYLLPVASRPRGDDVLLSVWQSSQTNGQAIIVRSGGESQRLSSAGLAQVPPLPF